MAKKKIACIGTLNVHFPDYITQRGTCKYTPIVKPGKPGFKPRDFFWHRDSLDVGCTDDVKTISGAVFRDEYGKIVTTEDKHPHQENWGTL